MDVRTLVGRVKGEREERFVVAIVKADLSGLVYLSPKLTEPEVREYFSNQGTSDDATNEYLKVARTNPPV